MYINHQRNGKRKQLEEKKAKKRNNTIGGVDHG